MFKKVRILKISLRADVTQCYYVAFLITVPVPLQILQNKNALSP